MIYTILAIIIILTIGAISKIGDDKEFKDASRYNQKWIEGYLDEMEKKKNKQKK
jgi:hypothetical protein